MPSKLSKQPSPPPPPAFLLAAQPEVVPYTDELEARYEALVRLKSKQVERSKLAAENIRACEEDIKRIKERERAKVRAVEKIKRERDCTYFLIHPICQAHEHITSLSSF